MHVFLLFPNYKAFLTGCNDLHDDYYLHDESHDHHPYDYVMNVNDETDHYANVNVKKSLYLNL